MCLIGMRQLNRFKKRKPKLSVVSVPSPVYVSLHASRWTRCLYTRRQENIDARVTTSDCCGSYDQREICDVIRSCSDYAECSPDDFQFIDMNGSISNCKVGFVWNRCSVK